MCYTPCACQLWRINSSLADLSKGPSGSKGCAKQVAHLAPRKRPYQGTRTSTEVSIHPPRHGPASVSVPLSSHNRLESTRQGHMTAFW